MVILENQMHHFSNMMYVSLIIWFFAVIRFTSVLADRSWGLLLSMSRTRKHYYYTKYKRSQPKWIRKKKKTFLFPIHYEACDISPIHHWGGPTRCYKKYLIRCYKKYLIDSELNGCTDFLLDFVATFISLFDYGSSQNQGQKGLGKKSKMIRVCKSLRMLSSCITVKNRFTGLQ